MAEGVKSNPPSELLPAEQANPAASTTAASSDKPAPSATGEQGEGDGIVEQSKKGGKLPGSF
jgi:hypothetical protein